MDHYASTQRRAYAYTIDLILLYLFCSYCINTIPGMEKLLFMPAPHPPINPLNDEQQLLEKLTAQAQVGFDAMGISDLIPKSMLEWSFFPQTWGDVVGDIISFFYFTLLIGKCRWQATLGMKMLGIYISTTYDEPPFMQQAVIRYLISIFNNYTLIGWLMIFFTKRRQGLHDMLSDTVVLRGSPATPLPSL